MEENAMVSEEGREDVNHSADSMMRAGYDIRLTILTVGVLALVFIMIFFIGYQAIVSERVFFKRMVMGSNGRIATLMAQQFTTAFSGATALVEDFASILPVVAEPEDSASMERLRELLFTIGKRHEYIRALYLVDAAGKVRAEYLAPNVKTYRMAESKLLKELLSGWVPSRLTRCYQIGDDVAVSYLCAVRGREDEILGVLVAEISLAFLHRVVDSIDMGEWGEILVVDGSGKIVFSSPGFDAVEEFNANFPVKKAFSMEVGGLEYDCGVRKVASFRRVKDVVIKPFDPMAMVMPFMSNVTARELPDFLIVVQIDASHGYMLAERMKWNVVMLIVVASIGLLFIGKLWLDSV